MTILKTFSFLFILILSIEQIVGPPAAIKNKHVNEKDHAINTNEVEVDDMMQNTEFEVEYKRYLDEVIKTLETDEDFKKKVAASNVDDINSGKIALELDMVNHSVRSKLDELKRQEVERLRELVKKKEELGHGPIHPSEYEHIDHFNLETFEVKDLDKLIKKVSKDMDKINEMRKEQFKAYEMEKQFEDHMKMNNMSATEQEEYKKHLEEMKQKHANHERIHHPGSKAQLEEVWEKQDHLENQDFDPKIFFHLHDIDSNGYWDQEEVKALFIKELDKMYQAGLPEDDMRERQEEMERMTEHVFKEMDKNGDKLISFQEYMDETKSKEFNRDDGWETLDKQQIYTQEEYEAFEKRRLAEIQKMIDQGLIPPEQYPGMQHHMGGGDAYMHQYHPNQVPQQMHPNQMGHHPNQVPHPGYHPSQMPQHPSQMSQHPNQMPQHPNQMPQHPSQMSQHPNQMPHYQNQMPQHPGQYQDHVEQQAQQYHDYHQNQPSNQVHHQQYQSNPPYQPGSQPVQHQQQYQNSQQHHPSSSVHQNNQDQNLNNQHNQGNNPHYNNQNNQHNQANSNHYPDQNSQHSQGNNQHNQGNVQHNQGNVQHNQGNVQHNQGNNQASNPHYVDQNNHQNQANNQQNQHQNSNSQQQHYQQNSQQQQYQNHPNQHYQPNSSNQQHSSSQPPAVHA